MCRPEQVQNHGHWYSGLLEYVASSLLYFLYNRSDASCCTVVAWAVTFTLPYLYNPVGGAGLGLKIGYIYSGGCILSALFIWLYIGETRGRTLEEINEMFARQVPARKWSSYRCDIATYGDGDRKEAKDDMGISADEERVEDADIDSKPNV